MDVLQSLLILGTFNNTQNYNCLYKFIKKRLNINNVWTGRGSSGRRLWSDNCVTTLSRCPKFVLRDSGQNWAQNSIQLHLSSYIIPSLSININCFVLLSVLISSLLLWCNLFVLIKQFNYFPFYFFILNPSRTIEGYISVQLLISRTYFSPLEDILWIITQKNKGGKFLFILFVTVELQSSGSFWEIKMLFKIIDQSNQQVIICILSYCTVVGLAFISYTFLFYVQ